MEKNKINTIIEFLKTKKFKIVQEKYSDSFGDFYIELNNEQVGIRLLSDRSIKYLEICNLEDKIIWNNIEGNNWYEVSIIQYILFNTKPSTINEVIDFGIINIYKLVELFSNCFYKETKQKITNSSAFGNL